MSTSGSDNVRAGNGTARLIVTPVTLPWLPIFGERRGMSHSEGKRKEKRMEAVHPIRLWGMDANGRPFIEAVTTLDISRTGARLKNPRAKIAVGDIVGLKSGESKSRFQVMWVGKAGTPDEGHVGLKSLDDDKGLWNIKPSAADSAEEIDTYIKPPRRDSRLVERLKCSLSVEVGSNNSAARTRTFVTDISLGGCYISMVTPVPVESKITLALWVDQKTKIWVDGIVIGSNPGLGMGIKFLNVPRRTIEEMIRLMEQVAEEQYAAEASELEV